MAYYKCFSILFILFTLWFPLHSQWELQKSRNGIDVYTRSVEGSSLKESKVEAIINASVDEIFTLLKQGNRFYEWYPKT